jgi:hypothetical protein
MPDLLHWPGTSSKAPAAHRLETDPRTPPRSNRMNAGIDSERPITFAVELAPKRAPSKPPPPPQRSAFYRARPVRRQSGRRSKAWSRKANLWMRLGPPWAIPLLQRRVAGAQSLRVLRKLFTGSSRRNQRRRSAWPSKTHSASSHLPIAPFPQRAPPLLPGTGR